jgi:hypothetical protein
MRSALSGSSTPLRQNEIATICSVRSQHLSLVHGIGDGRSCLGRESTPCLEDLLGMADEA